MSVVFIFGLTKAILTYMGHSTTLTTLDWYLGHFWPFGELGRRPCFVCVPHYK